MKRRWASGLVLVLLLVVVRPAPADMGKQVVQKQPIGRYLVSVFVSPEVPRAGPVEISVLVQDKDSGKSVLDVPVTIEAHPTGDKAHSISEKATRTSSTNKLLLSAVLEIPEPGRWDFDVRLQGPEFPHILIPLEVGQPLPAWLAYAGWVLWPLGGVAVFVAHRMLVRWRQRKIAAQPAIAETKPKREKARKKR